MVKMKKGLKKNCKFDTKIPKNMGLRELKLSKNALLYLRLNSPVSMNSCRCK